MESKKQRQKFISFAASLIVLEQLSAIEAKTGENRSQVIKRAIAEFFAKISKK